MRKKRWRAYCGFGQGKVVQAFKSVLQELEVEYRLLEKPAVFLSTKPSIRIDAEAHAFSITISSVEGDPIFRVFEKFAGSASPDTASFLSADFASTETDFCRTAVSRAVAKIPGCPWDLSNNVRLGISPYLCWRTKRAWTLVLDKS
jgi:hypothetical protein